MTARFLRSTLEPNSLGIGRSMRGFETDQFKSENGLIYLIDNTGMEDNVSESPRIIAVLGFRRCGLAF